MKLPRLTVRRLMTLVAVTALALGVDGWWRRFSWCERNAGRCDSTEAVHHWLAVDHSRLADRYRKLAADRNGSVRYNLEQAEVFSRAIRAEQAEARRAADRGREFRRAGLFPWLALPPIEPDGIGRVEPDRGDDEAVGEPTKARRGSTGH